MAGTSKKNDTFPCPSCNNPVRQEDTFCEQCGQKIEKPVCPSCRARAPVNARFCESCGSALQTGAAPPPPSPAGQVPPPPPGGVTALQQAQRSPAPPPPPPAHQQAAPEPVVLPVVTLRPEEPAGTEVTGSPRSEARPADQAQREGPSLPGPRGDSRIGPDTAAQPLQQSTEPQEKQAVTGTGDAVKEPEKQQVLPEKATVPEIPIMVPAGSMEHPGPPAGGKKALPDTKVLLAGAVVLILVAAAYFVVLPVLQGKTFLPGVPQAPSLPFTGSSPPGTVPAPAGSSFSGSSQSGSGAVSLSPQPTRTLPPGTEVNVQVDKSAVDGTVTVTLAGGEGKQVVSVIEVRLTRADGQVETDYIRPNRNIVEVLLPGTKQTDRLEVIVVQYSGQSYTIIDKLLEYRTRG